MVLIITGGILCGVVLMAGGIRTLGVAVAVCGAAVILLEPRRALINLARRRWTSVAHSLNVTGEMILYLSPIAMLSVAYPIASRRLDYAWVGDVHLTTLLLASSVTVPWLTQAVCLPLYQAVAPHVAARESDKITQRLCELWPTTFLQCLPVVVLFAVPMELSMRWSCGAIRHLPRPLRPLRRLRPVPDPRASSIGDEGCGRWLGPGWQPRCLSHRPCGSSHLWSGWRPS